MYIYFFRPFFVVGSTKRTMTVWIYDEACVPGLDRGKRVYGVDYKEHI